MIGTPLRVFGLGRRSGHGGRAHGDGEHQILRDDACLPQDSSPPPAYLPSPSRYSSLFPSSGWKSPQHQHQHGFLSSIGRRCASPACEFKKLPQTDGDLHVSVHKLDDTSFDIIVPNAATVLDLKGAIEKKFENWNSSEGQVSWPHLWDNFCLSFMDQKLIDEKAMLHQLGIRDNDQICFVRHLSNGNKPAPRRRHFFNIVRKKPASKQ